MKTDKRKKHLLKLLEPYLKLRPPNEVLDLVVFLSRKQKPFDVARAVELAEGGMSDPHIAAKVGTSSELVAQARAAGGVESRYVPKSREKKTKLDATDKRVLRMRDHLHAPFSLIACELGVSPQAARKRYLRAKEIQKCSYES